MVVLVAIVPAVAAKSLMQTLEQFALMSICKMTHAFVPLRVGFMSIEMFWSMALPFGAEMVTRKSHLNCAVLLYRRGAAFFMQRFGYSRFLVLVSL